MITWVSAANGKNIEDLRILKRSAESLAPCDHQFHFLETDDPQWRHTIKFRLLRKLLGELDVSHIFWIDADCEFVAPIREGELVDVARPLTAVRHFWESAPSEAWPDSFKQIVGRPPSIRSNWQSCIFGGTPDAVRTMLRAITWLEDRGVTYDEHILNWYWSANSHLVHTLPCRYASPSAFHAWHPDYEKSYRERAGGVPIIVHHNRATYSFMP